MRSWPDHHPEPQRPAHLDAMQHQRQAFLLCQPADDHHQRPSNTSCSMQQHTGGRRKHHIQAISGHAMHSLTCKNTAAVAHACPATCQPPHRQVCRLQHQRLGSPHHTNRVAAAVASPGACQGSVYGSPSCCSSSRLQVCLPAGSEALKCAPSGRNGSSAGFHICRRGQHTSRERGQHTHKEAAHSHGGHTQKDRQQTHSDTLRHTGPAAGRTGITPARRQRRAELGWAGWRNVQLISVVRTWWSMPFKTPHIF